MACIPTFEEVLLEIHQSLGLERRQSKKRYAFVDLDMPLSEIGNLAGELFMEVADALDMDGPASASAKKNWFDAWQFNAALILQTWTHNASKQQVLWQMLAHSYIPRLARLVAYWSQDAMERGTAFDAGMPGGEFWFLPTLSEDRTQVVMPVAKVLDWLLDLLGDQPLDQVFSGLESHKAIVRTLQGWRLEGTTPQSAKKIDEIFSDDKSLEFAGAFDPESGGTPFESAMKLVREVKGLDAAALSHQIPISEARLLALFDGHATTEDQDIFVRRVAERYAAPPMCTIRQRLKVARLVQDGYKRLLEFLCPDVPVDCVDPGRNKLYQVLALFQEIYNRTIDAGKAADSFEEQDAWFEAHLPEFMKIDLAASILPSRREVAHKELGETLSRRFERMTPETPLDDFVPWDDASMQRILTAVHDDYARQAEQAECLRRLSERVRSASPWRALQAESDVWVVNQLVRDQGLSPKVREQAIERGYALAETPEQEIQVCGIELGYLLLDQTRASLPGVEPRVEQVLARAESCLAYDLWKAPLLRWRARHSLMKNDFVGALDSYKAAVEAGRERNFGPLHGEIVRETWAVSLAMHGLDARRQKGLFNWLLAAGMLEGAPVTLPDAAVAVEAYFWDTLYVTYPGYPRVTGLSTRDYEQPMKELTRIVKTADWSAMDGWLKRHAKTLRRTNMNEVRRNSVLLLLIKFWSSAESAYKRMPGHLPLGRYDLDYLKMGRLFEHFEEAARRLLTAWPEQAGIADFKGQAPLMLAAVDGFEGLTRLLAAHPKTDINAQDHLGRTALHSAVLGGNSACIAAILEAGVAVDASTSNEFEQHTALHTAVRLGALRTVKQLADAFPGLALKVNAWGQTPRALAEDQLERFSTWREEIGKHGRKLGTRADLQQISVYLSEVEKPLVCLGT